MGLGLINLVRMDELLVPDSYADPNLWEPEILCRFVAGKTPTGNLRLCRIDRGDDNRKVSRHAISHNNHGPEIDNKARWDYVPITS